MTDSSIEIFLSKIKEAAACIEPWILNTPCIHSPVLSQAVQGEVYLKLENWQHTRSFKLRGAANKILSLSDTERERGLVLASTGNHAAACGHMARALQINATCVLPRTVSPSKKQHAERTGMRLLFEGEDCVETELKAQALAAESGASWIAPYNDPLIIAGQGTIALELAESLKTIDAALIPVGGGGLISGVAGGLKALLPDIQIIGCQPAASAVMAKSTETGQIIKLPNLPTLSDGTAGGVDPESLTFDYCRRWVDQWALVKEPAIARALRLLLEHHQMLVEGAAALTVAALLQSKKQYRNRRTVLMLTGARIHIETLKKILNGENKNATHL